MRIIRSLAPLIMPLLLAGSCSSPALAPMPPEEIVLRSVVRMRDMLGFHFVIDRSGAPAFLDSSGALAFRRAEGDFVAPDRAQATIRVIGPGLVTEVRVISIGDVQWKTNVLTGRWEEFPTNWGFNPAALFDAEFGIQPILESDLSGLEWVGSEELEEVHGQLLYVLTGVVDGERLNRLSFGMMGPGSMAVRLWIAPETFELYRMQITDPLVGEDEPTQWQIDFRSFDHIVEVAPPILDGDDS